MGKIYGSALELIGIAKLAMLVRTLELKRGRGCKISP